MYDRQTSQLIRNIPAIDGVDPARLPELLTESFIQIAVLRLRVNETGVGPAREMADTISRLRLLAEVLEVHAAVAVDSANREAAAFVSASAHQLLFQVRDLINGRRKQKVTVSARSISSRISSALLFLSAGYPADAAEVVQSADLPERTDPYFYLARAIASFCSGNMGGVLNRQQLPVPPDEDEDLQAEFILWERSFQSLRMMAARFIQLPNISDFGDGNFVALLESMQNDAVQPIALPAELSGYANVYSTFAGPHHLATLLLAAARGLSGRGLVDAPVPEGPAPDDWASFISRRARKRPFFWTNHMDALRHGLLNTGKSAAISFPTGAGKSTLAELKIATTILSGKKVVYLAPTLALVGQVARNLRDLLPENKVGASDVEDQMYTLLDTPTSEDVWVMTPERCLLLVTVSPEEFEDVGLIVFDECHAMHMATDDSSQRGIDAMLCLLKVMNAAPAADVLLMSALMSNGKELADWLCKAYEKDVLLFDAAWKPTRQARGSIIFQSSEINALHQLARANPKRIPQRLMVAQPFALLCLEQTWQSNSGENYRILPLTEELSKLRAERDRWDRIVIKSDTSALAIDIALRAAEKGLKSIVFFHVQASVTASVRKAGELSRTGSLALDTKEQKLFDAVSIELGGSDYVYLPNAIAGGHHGQLMPLERDLAESAFARADGIKILFSTNTLAQGMNLPADQVIIARTGSYDAESELYRDIQAHDLLNAAGRAGRAGHAANGMVLVIPDEIVTFDSKQKVTGNTIRDLKNDVLSQDDRCLMIGDPIDVILDRCMLAPRADDELLNSLALRLPPPNEDEEYPATVKRFFSRSFAAYKADLAGEGKLFDAKVIEIARMRQRIMGSYANTVTDSICSATGLSPQIVDSLLLRLGDMSSPEGFSVLNWANWLIDWFEEQTDARAKLLKNNELTNDQLRSCFEFWIDGRPLLDIELGIGTAKEKLGNLKNARRFVKNVVRNVSYSVGLVAQVIQYTDHPESEAIKNAASTAALLIREGVNTIEKLILLEYGRERFWTRVRVNQISVEWLSLVEAPTNSLESSTDIRRRVIQGIRQYEEKSSEIS